MMVSGILLTPSGRRGSRTPGERAAADHDLAAVRLGWVARRESTARLRLPGRGHFPPGRGFRPHRVPNRVHELLWGQLAQEHLVWTELVVGGLASVGRHREDAHVRLL